MTEILKNAKNACVQGRWDILAKCLLVMLVKTFFAILRPFSSRVGLRRYIVLGGVNYAILFFLYCSNVLIINANQGLILAYLVIPIGESVVINLYSYKERVEEAVEPLVERLNHGFMDSLDDIDAFGEKKKKKVDDDEYLVDASSSPESEHAKLWLD